MSVRTLPLLTICAAFLLIAGLSSCDEPPKATAKTDRPFVTNTVPVSEVPMGSGFDFYVLSLSWSPTWCAANDAAGKTQQCRDGDRGFIVHGLWPQHERGYPEFCRSSEPDRVPEALGRTLFDLIPSMGLIGHQWRKHGTCTGLDQADYFSVLRAARSRIVLPRDLDDGRRTITLDPMSIEEDLISANPAMSREGIAVTCENGRIEEIRICLTRKLEPRTCLEVDRQACRQSAVTFPPKS